MSTTITLYRVTNGNTNVILAKFPYDKRIYSTILNSKIGFWDKFHRGMILSNNPKTISDFRLLMQGIASINDSHLNSTTETKKKLSAPVQEKLSENLTEKIEHFKCFSITGTGTRLNYRF